MMFSAIASIGASPVSIYSIADIIALQKSL